LTPVIAVVVGWIAYEQYEINKRQLRLGLFEKRFAVFEATTAFIAHVLRNANVDVEERSGCDPKGIFVPRRCDGDSERLKPSMNT
jgi:hypothetical protein